MDQAQETIYNRIELAEYLNLSQEELAELDPPFYKIANTRYYCKSKIDKWKIK